MVWFILRHLNGVAYGSASQEAELNICVLEFNDIIKSCIYVTEVMIMYQRSSKLDSGWDQNHREFNFHMQSGLALRINEGTLGVLMQICDKPRHYALFPKCVSARLSYR